VPTTRTFPATKPLSVLYRIRRKRERASALISDGAEGASNEGAPETCDFSLQSVRSRPAKVGDKLVTRCFGTRTRGFAAAADKEAADRELDTQRANQARSRAPQGGCITSLAENQISRRVMLAATAAGGMLTATTLAQAQSDEQVLEPRRPGRGGSNPGPNNPGRMQQNPDIISPPATDHGTLPNLRFSFDDSHMRLESGGWIREIGTMMQSYASAAKPRGSGPILHRGLEDNQSFCMDIASCDLHEPVRREQARPVQ
jgi:hypothetical protein